jgi:23S rRNA pseudoU1915 N3-methylase RlmH
MSPGNQIIPEWRTPHGWTASASHTITDAQRAILEQIVRRQTSPQHQVRRARIVLLAAAGKTVALERLAQRVAQHDHAHIQQRVALTDGAEALQQQMQAHLPQHTLVLDIIHAPEYLWDAVTGWLGTRTRIGSIGCGAG